MKYLSLILFGALFLFNTNNLSFAQVIGKQRPTAPIGMDPLNWQDNLKQADIFFEQHVFTGAAQWYQLVLHENGNPNNMYAMYMAGESYRMKRYYSDAAHYFKMVLDREGGETTYPLARFWYATNLMQMEEYEEAEKQYNEFILGFKVERFEQFKANFKWKIDEADYYKRKAEQQMAACARNKEMIKRENLREVTNIGGGVNKEKSDFGAVEIDSNTLIFAGVYTKRNPHRNAGHQNIKKKSIDKSRAYRDSIFVNRLFISERSGNVWGQREILDIPLSSFEKEDTIKNWEYHVGNPVFSLDSTRLYFSVCKGDEIGRENCSVYYVGWNKPDRKIDGKVIKLGSEVNHESGSSKHPCIARDPSGKEVMYFSSNRIGGLGDFDIWYAVVNPDGTFNQAVNLGDRVNTVDDEYTPFYDMQDDALYFSSSGYKGWGGLDIYKVNGNLEDGWSTINNLGRPYNSGADDTYYYTVRSKYRRTEKSHAYLSSNRMSPYTIKASTCCDDIYYTELGTGIWVALTGKIFELVTDRPLPGTVKLYEITESEDTIMVGEQELAADEPYFFMLELDKSYFVKGTSGIHYPDFDTATTFHIVEPDTLVRNLYMPVIQDKVIHYGFDLYEVTDLGKRTVDSVLTVLNHYPTLLNDVSAHTDARGSQIYNVNLSKKRNRKPFEYMLDQGVDPSRIIRSWHGENKPVRPNGDETDDDSQGRAYNRRTEFHFIDRTGTLTIYDIYWHDSITQMDDERIIFTDKEPMESGVKKVSD